MHRKKLTRTLAITLVASLILATGALAAVLGELINGDETYLGAGMELSKGVYWTGSDYQTENYIEYTPGTSVYPVIVSGSKVCNYGNFASMAALLENQGKHVIGGMNGDYYVVANYEPLGIEVSNGELWSSDTITVRPLSRVLTATGTSKVTPKARKVVSTKERYLSMSGFLKSRA